MRTEQVVKLSGATPRQVEFWRSRGYITPSISNPSGSGRLRDWSETDVVKVLFMRHLIAIGMDPLRAAGWWDEGSQRIDIDSEFVSVQIDIKAMRESLFP